MFPKLERDNKILYRLSWDSFDILLTITATISLSSECCSTALRNPSLPAELKLAINSLVSTYALFRKFDDTHSLDRAFTNFFNTSS